MPVITCLWWLAELVDLANSRRAGCTSWTAKALTAGRLVPSSRSMQSDREASRPGSEGQVHPAGPATASTLACVANLSPTCQQQAKDMSAQLRPVLSSV